MIPAMHVFAGTEFPFLINRTDEHVGLKLDRSGVDAEQRIPFPSQYSDNSYSRGTCHEKKLHFIQKEITHSAVLWGFYLKE